jgi:hypothetical protein
MSAIPTTVGIESVNSDSVATPAQVFFEWNTATHVQDNEQSPAKRAFTKRELQDFFDHADDQVALIAASGRAWCAAKTPRYLARRCRSTGTPKSRQCRSMENTRRPQPVTATVANTPAAAPAARHRVDGWP